MAAMPRGEPRTVPDPEGEAYDRAMAEVRAKRRAEEGFHPIEATREAFEDWQAGPAMARPSGFQSLIPVVGPAWEAAADLQEGDYGGALLNAGFAAADFLPVGVGFKGLNAARKGVGVWKAGSVTAGAAAKSLRRKGVATSGTEIHHSVPLNGTSRTAQDWRNHYAFLKVLPKAQHRRLTGRWGDLPKYNPAQRLWYGTTDWMKAVPTGVASMGANQVENAFGRSQGPAKPPPGR